jgi:flavin-dependent dehydrogenase
MTDLPKSVDVLVVGAGPAGSVSAYQLARLGYHTLMVDQASFPRWKVCGCCLNGAGLATLERLGLGQIVDDSNSVTLNSVQVACRGSVATFDLPAGRALPRTDFDHRLITAAQAAGVTFIDRCKANWQDESADEVLVELRYSGNLHLIRTKAVIAADGLAAGFARTTPHATISTRPHSRIGAGVTIQDAANAFQRHCIHMAVGQNGYVGIVQLPDGSLDIAAALDVSAVQDVGMAIAAEQILAHSGFPALPMLRSSRWRGTPLLTRSVEVSDQSRIFLVGDAAGYIEPFTGEGMAWAIAGAHLTPEPISTVMAGNPQIAQRLWKQRLRELLGWRQWRCRLLTRGLRSELLTKWGIQVLNAYPRLADLYIDRLNQSSLKHA